MDPGTEDIRFVEPSPTEDLIPNSVSWEVWVMLGGILLLAILLVWVIWRQAQRSRHQNVDTNKEAHQEALAALAVCPAAEQNPAATECSLILRRYMARVTNDPALFETHEEWVSRHESVEAFGEQLKGQIDKLFAQLAEWKYTPKEHGEEAATMIERSRHLLEAIHKEVTA